MLFPLLFPFFIFFWISAECNFTDERSAMKLAANPLAEPFIKRLRQGGHKLLIQFLKDSDYDKELKQWNDEQEVLANSKKKKK